MASPKQQGLYVTALFCILVAVDQIIKIYIKTHFYLRESVEVCSWFYLSFIENNGMAYGMEFFDKYILTLFRLIMTAVLVYVMVSAIRQKVVSTPLLLTLTLILSGAVGNIIDCVCYGRLFTDSYGHVATWANAEAGLMPQGEWFKGRVVDMFYFPLIQFEWPSTFPQAGQLVQWMGLSFRYPSWCPTSDEPFLFFKPVFNFADACISVGVALLILFFRKDLLAIEQLFSSEK